MVERGGIVGRQGSQNYWFMGCRGKLVDAKGKAMKPLVDDKWEVFKGEIEGEVWKKVGRFNVSNFGRVKDVEIRGVAANGLYLKDHWRIAVCELVARGFVEGKGNYIRHKDGNIYNNKAENLEWSYEKDKKKEKKGLGLNEAVKIIENGGRIRRVDWSDNYCNYYSIKGEKIVDVDGKAMKLVADGWAEYKGDIKGEIWKSTKKYKGYEVSNYGRMRNARFEKPIALPLVELKDMGLTTTVYDKEVNVFWRVPMDKLVAFTFLGAPMGKGIEVIHKDGNIKNNYVDNLEWRVKK